MPEQEDFILSLLEDASELVVTPELVAKAAKETKEHIQVIQTPERTYLIVLAVSKEKSKNMISKVTCKKGIPIGGYVYDQQNDSYHVECCDYLHLGYVPISYVIRIRGVPDWEARVILPESVIRKFLSSQQKKELKNFKAHFRSADYDLEYIQMIDPN